jgi:formate--tetrahydrofolate ligase
MNLADYVVTEAGFGSDLGGEKFFDIVCNNAKLKPNVVVLVASIRSLKLHGGCKELNKEDLKSLSLGLKNLKQHITNVEAFNVPLIVAVNSFKNDTKNENNVLLKYFTENNIPYSFTTLFEHGSKGALDLANSVVKLSKVNTTFTPIYNVNEPLKYKIYKIASECYGAVDVVYSPIAKKKLNKLNKKKAYVCIAKTPITFSDEPKEIVINKPLTLHVKNLIEANGANFIIVMAGDIFRMPGLPKVPNACKM